MVDVSHALVELPVGEVRLLVEHVVDDVIAVRRRFVALLIV